jgi:O-antigen ligase
MEKIQKFSNSAAFYSVLGFAFFIPISPALMNIFLFLTLIFILLSGGYKQHLQMAWHNPVSKAGILLFALFALGTTWSIANGNDSYKMLDKYSELWYIALLMPIFSSPDRQRKGVNIFLISMTIILIIVYCIYFGFISEIKIPISANHITTISVDGGFRTHIITNILMSFAVFVFAQRLMTSAGIKRYSYAALCLSSAYYALFISTGTTGQILTTGLLSLFLIQHFHWKSVLFIPLMLSVMLGNGYLNHQSSINYTVDKVMGNGNHSGGSADQRSEFVKNGLLIFAEKPLFGHGTGSFRKLYSELSDDKILTKSTVNPHNEYISVAIQLGVVGLIGLIGLFTIQGISSFRISDREQRFIAQGLVALIVVASLGNSIIMDSGESHFWVFFSALLFAPISKKTYI